jgi:hypothetical protein
MAQFVWMFGQRGPEPQIWRNIDEEAIPVEWKERTLKKIELSEEENDWSIDDLAKKYPFLGEK